MLQLKKQRRPRKLRKTPNGERRDATGSKSVTPIISRTRQKNLQRRSKRSFTQEVQPQGKSHKRREARHNLGQQQSRSKSPPRMTTKRLQSTDLTSPSRKVRPSKSSKKPSPSQGKTRTSPGANWRHNRQHLVKLKKRTGNFNQILLTEMA